MKSAARIEFEKEREKRIAGYRNDSSFRKLSKDWLKCSMERKYVYDFDWLGRPIIQYPQDIVAVQEIVWDVRPDLIIETGIAHGGSLILSASLLALLDVAEAIENNRPYVPGSSKRKVIGIDIDIREHNREAIESHPFGGYLTMIQGSSVSPETIETVHSMASSHERVLVLLDSMHTHDHVIAELDAYAPLVSPGSYCVVFDTFVEDMPKGFFPDRPWDVGNNPKTAVREWLPRHPEFEVDEEIETKLQVTVAPQGFLRRRA